MAQSIMATGLAPERSFALARLIEQRLGERRPGRGRRGGACASSRRRCSARGGRAGGDPLPAVVAAAQPRPAARGAARRRHRRRQVDGRDPARQPARDHARDRDRPGPSGRAGILLARVHARRSPLLLRRGAGALGRCRTTAGGDGRGVSPPGARHRSGHRRARRARGLGAHADRDRGRAPPAGDPRARACASRRSTVQALLAVEGRGRPTGAFPHARRCRRRARRSATWRPSTASGCCRTIWSSAPRPGIPIIDEGGLEPALKRVMEVVLDAVGRAEEGDGGRCSGRAVRFEDSKGRQRNEVFHRHRIGRRGRGDRRLGHSVRRHHESRPCSPRRRATRATSSAASAIWSAARSAPRSSPTTPTAWSRRAGRSRRCTST